MQAATARVEAEGAAIAASERETQRLQGKRNKVIPFVETLAAEGKTTLAIGANLDEKAAAKAVGAEEGGMHENEIDYLGALGTASSSSMGKAAQQEAFFQGDRERRQSIRLTRLEKKVGRGFMLIGRKVSRKVDVAGTHTPLPRASVGTPAPQRAPDPFPSFFCLSLHFA